MPNEIVLLQNLHTKRKNNQKSKEFQFDTAHCCWCANPLNEAQMKKAQESLRIPIHSLNSFSLQAIFFVLD